MIRKEEVDNVSKLSPKDRYKYFIKKVADFEELWLLKNDNDDIALSEDKSHVLVPFWTAPEFLQSCQNGIWREYIAAKVTLDELEDEVLIDARKKGHLIDVFPINNKSGFVVSVEEFVRDLNHELENYK